MNSFTFDACYHFRHIEGTPKTKFVCIASTGNYPPFEDVKQRTRDGKINGYFAGMNDNFKTWVKQRTNKTFTALSKSISSLFFCGRSIFIAYGDTVGTNDALVFHFNDAADEVKIYVSRGRKMMQRQIYAAFAEGRLQAAKEAINLKMQAV